MILDNVVFANITDGAVTYKDSLTPVLTTISPRFGSVTGGTPVTFTGTNFDDSAENVRIEIDGVSCFVASATYTSVTCITDSITDRKTGLSEPSLYFYIAQKGKVNNTKGD